MKRSALILLSFALSVLHAFATSSPIHNGLNWKGEHGALEVQLVAPKIVRIDVKPGNRSDARTLSIDPTLKVKELHDLKIDSKSSTLRTPELTISVGDGPSPSITIKDASGQGFTESDAFADASNRIVTLERTTAESIYGIRGIDIEEENPVIARNGGGKVEAGIQGNAGAPFFFTPHYGVFIDSDGGTFTVSGPRIQLTGRSRDELEYFVIFGPPRRVMAGLADLTGHPPMSPKWTLGFLNSQWKINEEELNTIIHTYREKKIPLDGFILDFDWKAWGEDDYGEWRWNSTSSPENYDPNKFPDGASGKLARDLASSGVHLTGILKPRILLYKKNSSNEMLSAAAYAEKNHLWYPNEPVYQDYFTRRPSKDLNFNLPETRSWIWKHVEPTFDSGIRAWWNDEADHTELLDKSDFRFDNFQFFNMGRMLYEGQRGHSNLRVWTLNRNFYLGAQRYAYAEWSGDIDTGFIHMKRQPARMITTLNVGEPHWSMDVGGLNGHPSDENYARWMQFGAFVPIFRVHGDKFEKRQPWVYGPKAEEAAVKAIRLRYELMPYIYSAERQTYETGIGIVRPLLWDNPVDAVAASQANEWMFGDALLVATVLDPQAKQHSVYLPAGTWRDYASGQEIAGGKSINIDVDSENWLDIPLFVRDGSILATQPVQEYTNQSPVSEVTLDVFPSDTESSFIYYDDDGATYDYEKGTFYRQRIAAARGPHSDRLKLETPTGHFLAPIRTFLIRVHGRSAHTVTRNGKALRLESSNTPQENASEASFAISHDRFGPVTIVRVEAKRASELVLE